MPAKKPAAKKTVATKAVTKTPAKMTKAAASGVCPRCGTAKFGPEQRTRFEGNRTVRYTILVCERGHTFARPVVR